MGDPQRSQGVSRSSSWANHDATREAFWEVAQVGEVVPAKSCTAFPNSIWPESIEGMRLMHSAAAIAGLLSVPSTLPAGS